MSLHPDNKNGTNTMDYNPRRNTYLWLVLILVSGFLIRLFILDGRWINPDEGAHIMDGRLVLDGLVPKVDYDARQPFYVYVIALILKIFGISYLNVRFFFPMISDIGVALLIFLISKKLFNDKVALLATSIYTFLPLSIVESVIVKTEPLTNLLSCIGIYLVILGVWGNKRSSLLFFLSGVFLSFAYYVRESSLSIPIAILLFFIVAYWRRFPKLLGNYVVFLAGYLSICILVIAYYSQYMTFNQILESSINPLNIVFRNMEKFLATSEAQATALEIASSDFATQPWNETLRYLRLTLFSNSFLFVGIIFSIPIFIKSFLTKGVKEDFNKSVALQLWLLYSWILSLALAYCYWTLNRGYFIQYFAEFSPPLSILLAFIVLYLQPRSSLQRGNAMGVGILVAILALLMIIVFFFNRWFPDFQVKSVFYFLLATSVLSFFYFSQELGLKRWLYSLLAIVAISMVFLKVAPYSPIALKALLYLTFFIMIYFVIFKFGGLRLKSDYKKGLSFIALSFITFSFLFSFAVSGRSMGLDFDCVWSPETVKEVSEYIKTNSTESDEIISGAVIWELESNRRPFMNQSHPMVYSFGISPEDLKNIEWRLYDRPPKFVVLDGYTEKSYLRWVDKLHLIMDERYKLKKVAYGSRYPVRIYELDVDNSGR